jgi:hypothetical protein
MSALGRTETSQKPARTLTPAPSRSTLVTYRHPEVAALSPAEAGSAGGGGAPPLGIGANTSATASRVSQRSGSRKTASVWAHSPGQLWSTEATRTPR